MNRPLATLAMSFTIIAGIIGVATPTHALAGDPVVTVVASNPTPVTGDTVTFDVTIDQAGFQPTNGSQRTTYVSGGQTKNDSNYTVIPMTVVVDDNGVTHWLFTYHTNRLGRITFSVTVPVSQARIPRTVAGSAVITVVAA